MLPGRFFHRPTGKEGHTTDATKVGRVPPENRWRMELPARPENVGLLRDQTNAEAARFGMSSARIADLKIIVSEACANVVNYAYDDDIEGPLEVELVPDGDWLNIFVRDQGGGIRPRPEVDVPSLHLGLAMIGALSQRFDLSSEAGRGTELKIVLPLEAQRPRR